MEKLKEWWNKLSTQEKIALVLVVAGVAGYALYRRSKSSQSTNNAPNGGASVGQAVDQYGNPLYPTNLAGLYSQQPGGTFTIGSGSGGSGASSGGVAGTPGHFPSGFPGTFPGTFPRTATVRQAISGSQYDQQYGGVYTFTGPATVAGGGHTDQVVPFGSQIQILGSYIGSPYGGSGGGSSTYYLTPEGYISAQDVLFS